MKGQIEMQFNWLYIAIVGALVLLLVFSLSQMSIRSSQADLEEESRLIIKNIIAAQASVEAQNKVPLTNIEMTFSCYEYRIGDYAAESIAHQPLFAQRRMSNTVTLNTMAWDLPMHVTNFVYATGPTLEYGIVDDDKGRELYDLMPDVNKELLSGASEPQRIVTFQGLPPVVEDSTVLQVVSDDLRSGTLTFYREQRGNYVEQGQARFVGKAALVGAVFADYEMYTCNMEKALAQLKRVIQLKQTYAYPDTCPYDEALTLMDEMYDKATINNMDDIGALAEELQAENVMLQRLSCPLVY